MIVGYEPLEKPSADSPGCEEYFVVQCDLCGECWEVGPQSEELTVNMHVCEVCENEEEDK